MLESIALCVLLGLLLVGAALIRRSRNSPSEQARSGLSGAHRKVLETVALGLRAVAVGRAQGGRPLPDLQTVVHSGQHIHSGTGADTASLPPRSGPRQGC